MTNSGFQDRMLQEGQQVYDRILDGQVTDVEAELMDVHLCASNTEPRED